MIDTKTLMLGDWVEFNSDTMEVMFNCRVIEVGSDYVKTDSTGGDEIFSEDLFGVPIKKEILIGLFTDDGGVDDEVTNYHVGCTYHLEDGRSVWIGPWWNGRTKEQKRQTGEDPGKDWWEVVFFDFDDMEHGTKVRYVHELQHALRLFGVPLEIKIGTEPIR